MQYEMTFECGDVTFGNRWAGYSALHFTQRNLDKELYQRVLRVTSCIFELYVCACIIVYCTGAVGCRNKPLQDGGDVVGQDHTRSFVEVSHLHLC